MLVGVSSDLRFSVRSLARKPAFTAMAVTTIALGIGANTAMFSVVNAVLLRSLPFAEPEGLLILHPSEFSAPDYVDLTERGRSFAHLAAYFRQSYNLAGGSEAARIEGTRGSATLLSTLGVQPMLGRGFTPEHDRSGADAVAILTYELWRAQFAADEGVLGRSIELNGVSHTVIGVLPPGLAFPQGTQVLTPLALSDFELSNYNGFFLTLLARLEPEATPGQAAEEVARITTGTSGSPQYAGVRLTSVQESLVGSVRAAMLTLWAAVGFVLLIACANLANLLLTTATIREHESAVRLGLGAGRGRVVRLFFVESLLLAVLGGLTGVLLCVLALPVMRDLIPAGIPRIGEITIGYRVLGFTSALTVATGLLSGTFPALRGSRVALGEALKASGRSVNGSAGARRIQGALTLAQVALTVVLLTGAGLLVKSFVLLQHTPIGFDPEGLMTARFTLPGPHYPTTQTRIEFVQRLLDEVGRHPEIEQAALTSFLPFAGGNRTYALYLAGDAQPRSDGADFRSITTDYFRVMGIRLLRGREFSDADDETGAPVAIINQAMAERYWPGENPLGQMIKETSNDDTWREIVGVVESVRHRSREQSPRAEMFVPLGHVPASALNLVVRSESSSASAVAIAKAVAAVDPRLPLYELRTMEERLFSAVAQPRFRTAVLSAFATLALLMAAVGLYAVMAFSVAQRRRELAIRTALGANRSDVISMVVWQGAALCGAGIMIGVAGGWGFARVLAAFLYSVRPSDPVTFVTVPAIVLLVALVATAIPAYKATAIEPGEAFR